MLLTACSWASPARTANFSLKKLENSAKISEMTHLNQYIEPTELVSLETLTPLELMNTLTETNNVLQQFRPLSVRWDGLSSTLRLNFVPQPDHIGYMMNEFIIHPSMTSVVSRHVIRNMRPRNYRKLNDWAERMIQMHSVENILRWFDGAKQFGIIRDLNWEDMEDGKLPPGWKVTHE